MKPTTNRANLSLPLQSQIKARSLGIESIKHPLHKIGRVWFRTRLPSLWSQDISIRARWNRGIVKFRNWEPVWSLRKLRTHLLARARFFRSIDRPMFSQWFHLLKIACMKYFWQSNQDNKNPPTVRDSLLEVNPRSSSISMHFSRGLRGNRLRLMIRSSPIHSTNLRPSIWNSIATMQWAPFRHQKWSHSERPELTEIIVEKLRELQRLPSQTRSSWAIRSKGK